MAKIVVIRKKVKLNSESNSLEYIKGSEEREELLEDLGRVESEKILSITTKIAQDNSSEVEMTKMALKMREPGAEAIVEEKRLVE